MAGSFVAAVALGIKKEDATEDRIAAAKSLVEVVQFVEQTAELATHLTLNAGYFTLSLIALATAGDDTVAALRLARSFPALGANVGPETTADDVEFALLPLIVLARGALATFAAIFGDWLCWKGEHWAGVDSGRLVMAKTGMALLAARVTYMATQVATFSSSEGGLVLAGLVQPGGNSTFVSFNATNTTEIV